MIVQTSRKELFNTWLLWLDPILNLSKLQRKLLSALITLHYYHRHRYADVNALNETLFSQDNLKGIQEKLKFTDKSFKKTFKDLCTKGLIEENTNEEKITTYNLSTYLTQYPRDSKFKIQVEFKIE